MMSLFIDKQPMKYALYLGQLDIPEMDFNGNPQSYIDDEGNTIYIASGEKKEVYSEPVEFKASFSTSGGEMQETEYGLSNVDYDAVVSYSLKEYPIIEGTLIWTTSNAEYEDFDEQIYVAEDMRDLIKVKMLSKTSADYLVKKVNDSLNFTRLNLSAINK